jgi:hypothetical protein
LFGESGDQEPRLRSVRLTGADEHVLCAFARTQARELLAWTLDAEVNEYLLQRSQLRDHRGRPAVVRNGFQPVRQLLTNLGLVPVRVPKVRSRITRPAVFRSVIVRPYLRRSRAPFAGASLQFLRGLVSGDMRVCLTALMGPEGAVIPSAVVARVMQRWEGVCGTAINGALRDVEYISLQPAALDCAGPTAVESVMLVVGIEPRRHERLLAVAESNRHGVSPWAGALHTSRRCGLRLPPDTGFEDGLKSITQALAAIFPDTPPGNGDCFPAKAIHQI